MSKDLFILELKIGALMTLLVRTAIMENSRHQEAGKEGSWAKN